jgi:hypothetical protein
MIVGVGEFKRAPRAITSQWIRCFHNSFGPFLVTWILTISLPKCESPTLLHLHLINNQHNIFGFTSALPLNHTKHSNSNNLKFQQFLPKVWVFMPPDSIKTFDTMTHYIWIQSHLNSNDLSHQYTCTIINNQQKMLLD